MATILCRAIALFLALISFVAAQTVQWPPNPIPLVCHDDGVQIMAVVGTNVTFSVPGNQSYGLTVTFIEDVMGNIPNSDNFSLNYDRYPPYNQSAKYFIPDTVEGLPLFVGALKNYTTACPNTPIVLHGYSEGGVIIMNALCGTSSPYYATTKPISTSYVPHIIAVVLYGEESWVANQSYTNEECVANAPALPRSKPSACAPFAPVMTSYCFSDDVACCGSANATAPWPFNVNPHWLYPFYKDYDATTFVVGQYQKWQNGTLFNTTTSTSSSTISSTTSPSTSSKTSSSATITTTSSVSSKSSLTSITSASSSISSKNSTLSTTSASSSISKISSSSSILITSNTTTSAKPTTSSSTSSTKTSAKSATSSIVSNSTTAH